MAKERDTLSQDTIFSILSSPRRRYVLYYLRSVDEPVVLNDLADKVASWEYDKPVEDLTDQERKRVYVSLYQTHVPKLESVGLVEHDDETGEVSVTNRIYTFDDYLSEPDGEVAWQRYYLLLASLSLVVVVVTWLDAPLFGLVPDILVTVLVTLGFTVLVVAHYLHRRSRRQDIPPELGEFD